MESSFTLTDWTLLGLFGAAAFYAVVGNFAFFVILRSRGSIPFALGGLAVVVYFGLPRRQRSKTLDLFALTVLTSVAVACLAALLLFPRKMRNASVHDQVSLLLGDILVYISAVR
jgi:hypothetical protein